MISDDIFIMYLVKGKKDHRRKTFSTGSFGDQSVAMELKWLDLFFMNSIIYKGHLIAAIEEVLFFILQNPGLWPQQQSFDNPLPF